MREWIAARDLAQAGASRLFCLPHAGSGTAGFHRWKRLLPPEIAVCPVALPGREGRLSEPAVPHADQLVDDLLAAVTPHFGNRPYALFGHSMGALLAFGLAQRIESAGLPGPVRVFCSGREAPDLPAARLAGLPEDVLLKALVRHFGAEAAGGMDDPEMRALFLPLLRADLSVVESFKAGRGQLRCGITAWAGVEDESVTHDGLAGWESWSGAGFRLRRFAGGHFYTFREGQPELLRGLISELAPPASGAEPS